MDFDYTATISQAERDYVRARNQAFWSNIWSMLKGESTELLDFQEVRYKLRLSDERYLGRQEIPLDNIVGSVGRYKDFTRKFLPKRSVSRDRWKSVDVMTLTKGYPPIEVYKVGDAYFVLDGNHRVSVARANDMATIEAYVTEFVTDVPFDKNTTPEELFLKEGYAYFLRQTGIKRLRPESEVYLTEAINYAEIIEHIQVHHYFLGLECQCPVPMDDAVASWYDNVYTPMVSAIRESHILDNFPNRSETDLYVWLIRHQGEMQEAYGGDPASPDETLDNFLEQLK